MLFCIDHAIELGATLRPVFLTGEYAGCVFSTSDIGVVVGNTFVPPAHKQDIREGIELLMSHESAIAKIAEILNSMESEADNPPTILPAHIVYARDIHNFLRERVLDNSSQQQLQLLFRKLRFQQEMWEVTNPRHVASAVDLICRGEFPSRETPINLRLDAMWTKKSVYSVLASFNVRAPSLRGDTGLSLALSKDMYSKVTKPGRLVGIPVFAKAHDKALEDWEGILRDRQVWFAHKGADRMGYMKVKGRTLEVLLETPEAKTIVGALVTKVAVKRKADELEQEPQLTPDDVERIAEAKRKRLRGFGMIGLNFDLGEGTSASAMEVDEDPFE